VTYLSGIRVLTKGQHRLFDPLHKVLIIVDGIGLGIAAALLGRVEQGNYSSATSNEFGLLVKFPYLIPTVSIARGQPMAEIAFAFHPNQPEPLAAGKTQTTVRGYGDYVLGAVTPVYVDFWEKHRRWVRASCGSESHKWPPLFEFARMVRNFISHHSGHVHFDNPNAPTVAWHHLSYSPTDEGKRVIGAEMQLAELIILLFEMGDQLDQMGCPLNP
jgi:hypothetical protein